MIAGDALSVAAAAGAFRDKNAGSGKTVDISGIALGGADAGNYALADTTATTTASIGRAGLTLSGFSVENRTYDGTTAATIVNAGSLSGIISGDSVSFTHGAASFSDKNASAGKIVTLAGVTLGGADAGNYVLTGGGATTADVARAVISSIGGVTVVGKDPIRTGSWPAGLRTM